MELKILKQEFSICKVKNISDINFEDEFLFVGKTDEEISLVCNSINAPENAIENDGGWKGFRIQGVLDFSLVGILSKISTILTQEGISIFALSTYNTDYILIKSDKLDCAVDSLTKAGYEFSQ